jgi:hypothetical protein
MRTQWPAELAVYEAFRLAMRAEANRTDPKSAFAAWVAFDSAVAYANITHDKYHMRDARSSGQLIDLCGFPIVAPLLPQSFSFTESH